jgi:hypothetical protein
MYLITKYSLLNFLYCLMEFFFISILIHVYMEKNSSNDN